MRLRSIFLFLLAIGPAARADDVAGPDRLDVVASHPALGSIAERIGGAYVSVTSLCSPTGDVHAVEATPSVLARLSAADAFVHSGLDLELWAEPAVKGARNSRIRPGALGNVDCSIGIDMLDVPTNPSRADGDVHVFGNPHYWLDPQNGKKIAATICAAFCALAPAHAQAFQEERAEFEAEVNKKLIAWLKRALPHKGATVVCHHDSFPYFLRRFGFTAAAFVEPKPRIPPTQSHLRTVIDRIESQRVAAILREPHHDPTPAAFLAEKTGVPVVVVGQFPGSIPGSATYLDLIGADLEALLAVLEAK